EEGEKEEQGEKGKGGAREGGEGGESEADLVDPLKLKEKNRKTLKNELREKPTDIYDTEIANNSEENKQTAKPKSASDPKNKTEVSKLEVEKRARKIVIDFERNEGRKAEDCSANKWGYDIISRDGKSKRYIEVKGSKNDTPSFNITKNEWLVAEELKDEYYIYRVAYIKKGHNRTSITIIRNPAKQLAKSTMEIIVIKNWRDAFDEAETVEFEENETKSSGV
ncbi:MAG: DUF3883 domain-containing protein, partial [Candidatus Methanoperedens sp.]|nr:DUF3883 domain-containing protein [Candidatus Methanoperedens sp.]